MALLALMAACSHGPTPASSEVPRLSAQADAALPLMHTPWVQAFVREAKHLPSIAPRVLWVEGRARAATAAEWDQLASAARTGLVQKTFGTTEYYETRSGSPVAYARALQVAGLDAFNPRGQRIFDFGYGGIGHLKMLAGLGAHAVGVDVDPMLRALYSWQGDQGPVPGGGTVQLFDGRFPADPALSSAVGGGYVLVVSKNVLKRGYIHPEQPVDDSKFIHLGVDDATFLAAVYRMLVPGGRFLIYNICPGPNRPGKPYVTWADGRSPFSREAFATAGFRVLAFEQDDLQATRALGHALGWDNPDGEDAAMDLVNDLQSQYTLVEK
jgi:SAM-dependent methyltransferase